MIMIPRILHFVWVGGKPMPTKYTENMERWKEHHPNWKIRLWTDVPSDVDWHWIVLCEHRPVQLSDILRTEMVYRHGGVYADLDSWPVQSIERIIDGLHSFMVKNQRGEVDNHIFGATKLHPWLRKVLDKVWTHYTPRGAMGAMGGSLFIKASPLTYANSRLFDYGILNANPKDCSTDGAVVIHSQDQSWKKHS